MAMKRRVNHILALLAAFIMALPLTGCHFRKLQDPSNSTYVRVYVDEVIKNVNTGFYNPDFVHPEYKRPEILRIGLFDHSDGHLVSDRYLRGQGDDERGHYYDGYITAAPGTYDFVAYNFGTEATIVGSEYDLSSMTAYTNEISPSLRSRFKADGNVTVPIRYDADHLFVANGDGIKVKTHMGPDTLRSNTGEPFFRASSVVQSWYLQIGVVGSQWVASAVCVLDGMASSVRLKDRDFANSDETALYMELLSGTYPDNFYPGLTDFHCIYTTFGTFGKLPNATNNLVVTFEFITTYGKRFEVPIDITEEFFKPDATNHQWLIISKIIEIPEPEGGGGGGGMNPSVTDWDDVKADIII